MAPRLPGTPHDWQLQRVVEAARIVDGQALSWLGRRVRPATATESLSVTLAGLLYDHFYIFGVPVGLDTRERPAGREPDFVWLESVAAAIDGLPTFLPVAAPGFAIVRGRLGPDPGTEPMTRLYWNAHADGAALLVGTLTRELNSRRIPFTIKLVNSPPGYARADALILYVPDGRAADVLVMVAEHHGSFAWALKGAVPAFTSRIAAGLGVAQDPGNGESFGQHRCRLLAEALCEAASLRGPARFAAVLRALERKGWRVDAPHLRTGTAATTAIDVSSLTARARDDDAAAIDDSGSSARALAAAVGIGDILTSEALWRDGACTWLGPRPHGHRRGPGGAMRHAWSPIGADVYAGTAGVGLFLAQLARISGERRFAELASGALIYAAEQLDRTIAGRDASFYLGWTGVAFALQQAGRLLLDEALMERAERVVRERLDADLVCVKNDWLAGLAGHIAGLLALARGCAGDAGVLAAERLGRELLSRASRSGEVLTWTNDHDRSGRPWTGLAHGAAGIALALAELASATGAEAVRDAALSALHYEQRLYSPAQRNWPDLRRVPTMAGRARGGRRYAMAWCHGAPGIGLARVLTAKLLGEPSLLCDARIALESTIGSMAGAHADGLDRMVLCHGLGGNLMIARELARHGIALTRDVTGLAAGLTHVCSIAELAPRDGVVSRWMRRTPSLLTGAAGLGHFLLSETADALSRGVTSLLTTIHEPQLAERSTGLPSNHS